MTLFIKGKRRPRGEDVEVEYAPGGLITPGEHGHYVGTNAKSIANNLDALMGWEFVDGAQLLDLSDPDAPTIKDDGLYAFKITINAVDPLTVGGFFRVILYLQDPPHDNEEFGMESRPASTAWRQPQISADVVFPFSAGSFFKVSAINRDGAATRLFGIENAIVVRLA